MMAIVFVVGVGATLACLLTVPLIARAAGNTPSTVTDLGSGGTYSGPIAPGDHIWYRFWYPGGASSIGVDTKFLTGARADTVDTYALGVRLFPGDAIESA